MELHERDSRIEEFFVLMRNSPRFKHDIEALERHSISGPMNSVRDLQSYTEHCIFPSMHNRSGNINQQEYFLQLVEGEDSKMKQFSPFNAVLVYRTLEGHPKSTAELQSLRNFIGGTPEAAAAWTVDYILGSVPENTSGLGYDPKSIDHPYVKASLNFLWNYDTKNTEGPRKIKAYHDRKILDSLGLPFNSNLQIA